VSVLWPDVLPKLRIQREHWRRRLHRFELLAAGGRVDFERFARAHAYVHGKADAYDEAWKIIEDGRVGRAIPLDWAVLLLAQQGTDVEAIANRCGVSLRVVAESLARFAQAALDHAAEEGRKQGE
jgi:hypothetical protein